jgi:ABC-2 type transport system permease protein
MILLLRFYRRWRPRQEVATSAAARGPLGLFAHQVRFDLLASFRNPRARFFTFVFPLLLLVVFAGVFGHGATVVDGVRVPLTRFFVPGILTLSIVTAAYGGLVNVIVTAREAGIFKRRRATPAPAWVLVGGQAASTLVTTLGVSAVLLLVSRVGWGVGFGAASLAALACAVVVGTLAMACVGFAVAGLIGSADAAQPIVQLTMMPLYFISGVWIPTSQLSHSLQTVASIFPIEHLAAAAHLASVQSTFSGAFAPGDLLALAAWGVGAAVFAARRFTWLPQAATA